MEVAVLFIKKSILGVRMSNVFVKYNSDNFTYHLVFESALKKFEAQYKVEVPESLEYLPVKNIDGFVAGIIFAAMEDGEDLFIEQPMTLRGIQNLTYFIEAWANMLPDTYMRIKIIATTIISDSKIKNNKAISAFSGGVDACFTLLRNMEKDWGSAAFDIDFVLSVQGFDIPSDKYEQYDQLMKRVAPIYEQFSCKGIKVWTNIKDKSKQNWDMSHAAQLASCLHLFSEHFSFGLLGSSDPYSSFFGPWGSMPSTDFLLSTGSMEIVHDGSGYSRTEKVGRIASNQLMLDKVKVCYQVGYGDNCGQCEKCYRTRLNFLAAGVNNPACFKQKIKLGKIRSIKLHTQARMTEYESILDYCAKHKQKNIWLSMVKYVLIKNYFLYHIPPIAWIRNLKYLFKKKK